MNWNEINYNTTFSSLFNHFNASNASSQNYSFILLFYLKKKISVSLLYYCCVLLCIQINYGTMIYSIFKFLLQYLIEKRQLIKNEKRNNVSIIFFIKFKFKETNIVLERERERKSNFYVRGERLKIRHPPLKPDLAYCGSKRRERKILFQRENIEILTKIIKSCKINLNTKKLNRFTKPFKT